jgi:hypothetical protein
MPVLSVQAVIGMAQILLRDRLGQGDTLTREVIEEAVEFVSRGDGAQDIRDLAVRELETRYHILIGESKTLQDNSDHIAWLPTRRAEIDWRYWNRYRQYLDEKMPPRAVDNLDEIADDFLARLEDPKRPGSWSRRGLVVGHVQSGKTANYTGLICKAADAGYKVIVVLAGMHKNLRSQTQIRLDEGFLGYKSSAPTRDHRAMAPVGVGLVDPALRADTITNRSDNGDFKRSVARNFSISPGGKPLLFVVKKNGSVLQHLLDWVAYAADSKDAATNRPIVRNVPLLVIDDEADHGSVDTKELPLDENGVPDGEHEPVVINQRIRRLLHCFDQNAYVGYTATPFANIYIHEAAKTVEHGEDLFPRSFITNIPAPSNYLGALRLFGTTAAADGDVEQKGLPVVRIIGDNAKTDADDEVGGWMPPVHDRLHRPLFNGEDRIPPSLATAIRAFVLGCAARRARGDAVAHKTMLVHVTRFTDVQALVYAQVARELSDLRARLRNGDGGSRRQLRAELRSMWEDDFVHTTRAIGDRDSAELSWGAVEEQLWEAISAIEVKQINGSAKDVADYEENKARGLNVIVIGGDKLSRGLTLEGLMVSYFLRASRMYDTLMQMGRWFGYRPRYSDLCRLYLTQDLREWFEYIAEASEELRAEFDYMATIGATPKEYGLKVRSHPVLLITSAVKSRHGRELQLTFQADIAETVAFHVGQASRRQNIASVEKLLASAGSPAEIGPNRTWHDRTDTWPGTFLWQGVGGEDIARFLEGYKTHPAARKVNGQLLADFIRVQNAARELLTWTVVLLGGGEGAPFGPLAGCRGRCTRRAPLDSAPEPGQEPTRYRIRRLLSPKDEAIDLTAEQYERALRATREAWTKDPGRSTRTEPPEQPSGPMLRRERASSCGLLLVYPLDPDLYPEEAPGCLEGTDPIIGVGVSFPGSSSGKTVRYKVNNVYWLQEFGGQP